MGDPFRSSSGADTLDDRAIQRSDYPTDRSDDRPSALRYLRGMNPIRCIAKSKNAYCGFRLSSRVFPKASIASSYKRDAIMLGSCEGVAGYGPSVLGAELGSDGLDGSAEISTLLEKIGSSFFSLRQVFLAIFILVPIVC